MSYFIGLLEKQSFELDWLFEAKGSPNCLELEFSFEEDHNYLMVKDYIYIESSKQLIMENEKVKVPF
jgi:hypothetical protein